MTSDGNKLSLGEKLGYALGDAAANFVLQLRLAFLPHFYTDFFGISPGNLAKLQLMSGAVDACNDLVMGALSDRTHTRRGKFRPWIFWSSIPLGLTAFLAFSAPDLSANGKMIYAAITLNLLIIAYGANNVPYSALGGVISDDPDERQSVASWRMGFAMLATLVVLAFTNDMRRYFGGGVGGYRTTAAVWATLAVACSLIAFFTTRERIAPRRIKESSLAQDLAVIFKNPAWRVLAISSLVVYITLGIRGSMALYYFQYVLQRDEYYFGEFNAIGMGAVIVGIFFSKPLTDRFGKRNVYCGGLALSAALVTGFNFFSGDQIWLIRILQVAFQVSFGATMPIIWGMIADVVDYTEWQFGRRNTALTFAATLFCFKVGQAIGNALTPLVLAANGYAPNVEQSDTAKEWIRTLFSTLPAGLLVAAALIMLRYVITHDMEEEMTAALRERREQQGRVEE